MLPCFPAYNLHCQLSFLRQSCLADGNGFERMCTPRDHWVPHKNLRLHVQPWRRYLAGCYHATVDSFVANTEQVRLSTTVSWGRDASTRHVLFSERDREQAVGWENARQTGGH